MPKAQQAERGCREVKRSLRTHCRKEAIRRSWRVLDELADIVHGREPEAVSSPVRGTDDVPQPSAPAQTTPDINFMIFKAPTIVKALIKLFIRELSNLF
ncbi:DUF6538 domain-containing protein [Ferrimonas senticii]|uniref:DUF6538 domain-containing protein n=1 Tax=Ferrimonas senticii TaxID=394566 RepID=UPI003B8316EA